MLTQPALRGAGHQSRRGPAAGGGSSCDGAGKPTGAISGDIAAIAALFSRLPAPNFDEKVDGTRKFFSELNRLGLTGVIDPGGFNMAPAHYRRCSSVWRDGQLTVRVAYSLFSQNGAAPSSRSYKGSRR